MRLHQKLGDARPSTPQWERGCVIRADVVPPTSAPPLFAVRPLHTSGSHPPGFRSPLGFPCDRHGVKTQTSFPRECATALGTPFAPGTHDAHPPPPTHFARQKREGWPTDQSRLLHTLGGNLGGSPFLRDFLLSLSFSLSWCTCAPAHVLSLWEKRIRRDREKKKKREDTQGLAP